MTAAISTLLIRDAGGTDRAVQAVDLSGTGAGPWSFLHAITDRDGNPNSAAYPLRIAGTLTAGSAVIGSVAGRTANPVVTPTVTASSAYASGNVVGGKLTFSASVDVAGSGVLQSIRLSLKSVQTAGFKLWLFNADPSASTFADKSAPSIAGADVGKLIGVWALASGDSGLGTHTLFNLDGLGKSFSVASGTSLWGVLTTTGTPTFAATSDVSIALGILED